MGSIISGRMLPYAHFGVDLLSCYVFVAVIVFTLEQLVSGIVACLIESFGLHSYDVSLACLLEIGM